MENLRQLIVTRLKDIKQHSTEFDNLYQDLMRLTLISQYAMISLLDVIILMINKCLIYMIFK